MRRREMNKIPRKLNQEMNEDPEYKICMRAKVFKDHVCRGRITREHALIYAGKQIQEKWAIVPICAWAHDVDEFQDGHNLDKEKNEYLALMRATPEDLAKYPRKDWQQLKRYYEQKFKDHNTGRQSSK